MQLLSWSRCALGVAVIGGCTFAPAGGSATDGSVPPGDGAAVDAHAGDGPIAVDARPTDAPIASDAPGPINLPYLEPGNEQPGTGDWTITDDVSFTTDLNPAAPGILGLPAGVTFTLQTQTAPNSRTILVLHVRRLELQEGVSMYLYGSRPLAIVAGDDVVIDGVIDASAWLNTNSGVRSPGPGGFSAADVAGAGGGGLSGAGTSAADSGGGGGGHGTVAGRGGGVDCTGEVCTVVPGAAGSAINSDLFYFGGGGRGAPAATRTSCIARAGGAGGGGILVYSPTSISVGANGVIEANGGGGGGGRSCSGVGTLAGSGGGAGGQVELQAPAITITDGGLVIANSGSGGGGAANGGTPADGSSGFDGADSLTDASPGGHGGSVTAGDGGAGSIGSGPGSKGADVTGSANAGGGGGGGGRIIVRYRGAMPSVLTSPPATLAPY